VSLSLAEFEMQAKFGAFLALKSREEKLIIGSVLRERILPNSPPAR